MNTKKKYFWYLIVGLNGVGVWLPAIITIIIGQEVSWKDIPQNMAIYFVTIIVSGCADKGIELLERLKNRNQEALPNLDWASLFMDGIGVLVLSVFLLLIIIISAVNEILWLAYLLGIIGVLVSLKICWYLKVKGDSLNASAAIPGPKF